MNTTLIAAFDAVKTAICSNKELLTSLDAAIGDADHGINMDRGFTAVIAKLQTLPAEADLNMLLKTTGMTLISTVGGASGPLYGTAFMRAAEQSPKGSYVVTAESAQNMLQAALKGIQDRGKAVRGEKTMIDALEPAIEAFKAAVAEGKPLTLCLEEATAAAQAGVEYTKTIIATKGRASYLGERSLGHQDAGATSSTLMLQALTEFLKAKGLGV